MICVLLGVESAEGGPIQTLLIIHPLQLIDNCINYGRETGVSMVKCRRVFSAMADRKIIPAVRFHIFTELRV